MHKSFLFSCARERNVYCEWSALRKSNVACVQSAMVLCQFKSIGVIYSIKLVTFCIAQVFA
jgi:hypothetical protein